MAPASSKAESAIEALSPAPFSTATVAPWAANFLTVSGIAAQRVSPAASFRTAIFIDYLRIRRTMKPTMKQATAPRNIILVKRV
jgi:hypothetical protein